MRFFTHEFPTGKELRSNLEAEASQRGHSQDHSEFCSTHFFRLRSFVSTIQKSQFVYVLVTKYYICSPRGRRAFRELRSRPGPLAADQVLGRVSGQSLGEVTAIFLQYSNAKRQTATLRFGARRCGGRVNGEEEEEGGFDLEHWRSCTKREKGLVGIFSITNHSLS